MNNVKQQYQELRTYLLEQIKRAADKNSNTIHVCESAIDICNNLLREPEK